MTQVDPNPDFADPVEYTCTLNFATLGYLDSEIGEFYHYYEAVLTSGEVITSLSFEGDDECNYYGPYVKSESSMSYSLEISSTNPLGSGSNSLSAGEEIFYILKVSDPVEVDTTESPLLTYSIGNDDFDFEMELVELSPNCKDATYVAIVAAEDLDSGCYSVEISEPTSWSTIPPYIANQLNEMVIYNFVNNMILNFGDTINTFGNIFMVSFAVMGGLAYLDKPDYLTIAGISALVLFGVFTVAELGSLEASGDTGGLLGLALGCMFLYLALDSMFGNLPNKNSFEALLGYFKFFSAIATFSSLLSMTMLSLFPEEDLQLLDMFDNIMYIFPQLLFYVIGLNVINALLYYLNLRGSSCVLLYQSYILWYKTFVLMLGVFAMISFLISLFGDYDEFAKISPF